MTKLVPSLNPPNNLKRVNSPKLDRNHKTQSPNRLADRLGRNSSDIKQLAKLLIGQQVNSSEKTREHAEKIVITRLVNQYLIEITNPVPCQDPDVIFFPQNNATEFVNLVGLEHVVVKLKKSAEMAKEKEDANKAGHLDTSAKVQKSESKIEKPVDYQNLVIPAPFECSSCETDFSPQWHPDETKKHLMYCSNCVTNILRKNLEKNYRGEIMDSITRVNKFERETREFLKIEIDAELMLQQKQRQELAEKRIAEVKRIQAEEAERNRKKEEALAKKNHQKISDRDFKNALIQKEQIEKMLADRKSRGRTGKNVSKGQNSGGLPQSHAIRNNRPVEQNFTIKDELTKLMTQMTQPGFPAEHTQTILATKSE